MGGKWAKGDGVRILVTGGAGFLGSHLADRLVADGHEVVLVDNLSTGRRRNVERLLAGGRATLVEADVVDPLPVEGPFGQIFHLASPVTIAHHAARPIATLRTAAEGTRQVLDLAAEWGAVFLLASTSEVYGDPKVHPQVESDVGHTDPVGVRSPYNEGKRFAESLAVAYRRERSLKVRIARIFNTYGPRMRPDDGRVIPSFIAQSLAGKPVRVFGTGEQTRSFCYVSDMVEALVRLAETEYGDPVNLGNPEEVTVLEVAREIVKLTGSSSRIEFGPLPEEDPARRRPDIGLARRLLGWEPTVPRREGLRRTIDYFRNEERIP
jgi:nucleoside-diphosphate-sugar epimerase